MTFEERILKSKILIKLLNNYFWNDVAKEFGIIQCPWGYENTLPDNMLNILKQNESPTANYIRFQPDCIIAGKNHLFLLEYKVNSTPRYSEGQKQWNIGQIELDAWNTYLKLISINVNIAILIYCPYHSRPLLCDIPKPEWQIRTSFVQYTTTGSGTPYINIDLQNLTTFSDFIKKFFDINLNFLNSKVYLILSEAKQKLPISHDPKSSYQNYETGWNWLL